MARRISPLALIPPIAFVIIAALFWLGLERENPDALPSTLVGRAAPALTVAPLGELPPVEDSMIRADGVKLVNFWASWCVPCRVEHPVLMKLSAEGVPIYGVNYKDRPEQALGFLERLGNPFRAIGADPEGRLAIEWGVYGIPETFVIDGRGRVVLRFPGPITETVLENTIRPAIARAQASESQASESQASGSQAADRGAGG